MAANIAKLPELLRRKADPGAKRISAAERASGHGKGGAARSTGYRPFGAAPRHRRWAS
jgi:hypothetical protein